MSKKVLFAQGGGMRRAFSFGAMMGLIYIFDDEYLDIFDEFTADSASCATQVYLLSGQFKSVGYEIWTKGVKRKHFLNKNNIFRLFSKNTPFLDFHYLTHALFKEGPYNIDYITFLKRAHKITIPIYNLNIDKTEFIQGNSLKNKEELHTLLNAATAAPIAYDRAVTFRGNNYCDGGFQTPLPLSSYKNMKKLVISTISNQEHSTFSRKLICNYFYKYGRLKPSIYSYSLDKIERFKIDLKVLKQEKNVLVISPLKTLPSLVDNSEKSLKFLIAQGYEAVLDKKEEILQFLEE